MEFRRIALSKESLLKKQRLLYQFSTLLTSANSPDARQRVGVEGC
jgi:hypothetical protein